MTDQEYIDPAGENAPVKPSPAVDWYLQSIVNLADYAGLEMDITLTVSGSEISGKLIGGKKYFTTFAEQMAAGWPEEGRQYIRDAFGHHAGNYETGDENSPPAQFIHLEGARFISPNGNIPSDKGMLWRGKLSAVSGFSLGSIGPARTK